MSPDDNSPASLGTDALLAALDQRFSQRRQVSEPPASRSIWRPYVLAAAVLHVFDPKRLQPYGKPIPKGDPGAALFDVSVPAVGWRHARLRSLKPEVRRAALEELGSRGSIRRALRANPDRTRTTLQVLFERWANDEPIVPERLSYTQLEHLRELYDWGLERFGPLPDRKGWEEARVRRASVSMFEHLVDECFIGREEELQLLRDHVGVVSPSRWARLRGFLASGSKPPLVIWGPGGTGKTALIGSFLMEHVESAAKAGWFPFAYLPFDSDAVDVREPFTLLVAASSQLQAQVGHAVEGASKDQVIRRNDLNKAFDVFREGVERYRDSRGVLRQRTSSSQGPRERLSKLSKTEQQLYFTFGVLLKELAVLAAAQQGASRVPVLFVLDTFEEVLYRTNEELRGLWRMFETVQEVFPALRIVIASRTQPRPFEIAGQKPNTHELGDLEERDALTLMQRLGVEKREVARAIVHQVGRNPLTLRLAARVARDEAVGDEGFDKLKTRKYFLIDVAPELIRGQLYRRVLDHIHDDDVRALAHPGMVLRRVTEDLIQKVLTPICKLPRVDHDRARELFEQLSREHAFVRIEDDKSLRYREEVRRPLLELLRRDKPDAVKEIHKAATEYYRSRDLPDPVERAEEFYHLLMQTSDFGAGYLEEYLAERWLPGVEGHLASAVDELPKERSIVLASQMSIELPPEAYELADLARWERLLGRKALAAFRHGGPEVVLGLLRGRKERTPDSPLYAIEARALVALERHKAAATLLDRALKGYPAVGNAGRLAELLWIRSQVSLSSGHIEEAATTLERLAKIAQTLSSPLPFVQALTELVDVKDALKLPDASETRGDLASALSQLEEWEVDKERALVRLALARLGPAYPAALRSLLPFVIYDWTAMMGFGLIDVRPALAEVERVLRASEQPRLLRLANLIRENRGSEAAARRVAQSIIDFIGAKPQDPHEVEAVFYLLQAERASLREATLAGLESYKEPWEFAAAPEVRA